MLDGSSVLVYDGRGTSPRCVAATIAAIASHVSVDVCVRAVSNTEIARGGWEATALALVVPGGRDLPYCEDLSRVGAERVRAFVKGGGSYIGLCAGAYFGAARCEFDVGGPLEVQGPRPLHLFPGTAVGSVYGGFQYDSRDGGIAATIAFVSDPGQAPLYGRDDAAAVRHPTGPPSPAVHVPTAGPAMRVTPPACPGTARRTACYFEGGCRFDLYRDLLQPAVPTGGGPAPGASDAPPVRVRVLAWYDDADGDYNGGVGGRGGVAAVVCSHGRGRAVLCGVHPELCAEYAVTSPRVPCAPPPAADAGDATVGARSAQIAQMRARLRSDQLGGQAFMRMLLLAAGLPLQPQVILSYGALLSERSARLTFPSLRNFRTVQVRGFRRVCVHPHVGLCALGLGGVTGPSARLPIGSLAAEACHGSGELGGRRKGDTGKGMGVLDDSGAGDDGDGDSGAGDDGGGMVCAAFEVELSGAEEKAFAARESEYVFRRVPFQPLPLGPAPRPNPPPCAAPDGPGVSPRPGARGRDAAAPGDEGGCDGGRARGPRHGTTSEADRRIGGGTHTEPRTGAPAAAAEAAANSNVGRPGRPAHGLMCVAGDDEAFREAAGPEAFDRAVSLVGGSVWGWPRDSGLTPHPLYIRHCILAARALGEEAAQSLERGTLLIDRRTSLASHLASAAERGEDVMAEGARIWAHLESDLLRDRFGG